jgi:type II secretory pathway component GspD/PulD (secretin)
MHGKIYAAGLLILIACMFGMAGAQDLSAPKTVVNTVLSVQPDYVPPSEILDILGVRTSGNIAMMRWMDADGPHTVEIRHNDAANLIILTGGEKDVEFVEAMISEADIAPRQIEIEVQIIEISKSKAQDIGIDWSDLVRRSSTQFTYQYEDYRRDNHDVSRDPSHETIQDRKSDQIYKRATARTSMYLGDILTILDQSGAATFKSAPKILTLNNRRATILDGQRVTYITRYSSYTNLYETDSMDAGLTLSVLPSLGESGYITLKINAEMTALDGQISGSPVKTGQLVENTVVVRDGESVLLGGLTRSAESHTTKRFPVLGYVLPFIFSREVTNRDEIESFMILTPKVVDFSTALDEETKAKLEGK